MTIINAEINAEWNKVRRV